MAMSEMTVREHNEQLILERAYIEEQHRAFVAEVSKLIAALMGRNRTKTISPEAWAKTASKTITCEPQPDGSRQVVVVDQLPESIGKTQQSQRAPDSERSLKDAPPRWPSPDGFSPSL